MISFYTGFNGTSNDENKIDYATAKATAETMAKKLEPRKI